MLDFPEMARFENYLVALAGIVLSGLVSVYSKELRGFITAGVRGFRNARIKSLKRRIVAARELHDNLQVLTAMIGLKITRMFILTMAAFIPALGHIFSGQAFERREEFIIDFMLGVILSEIVGFNRQLWRSLNLETFGASANTTITKLEEKLKREEPWGLKGTDDIP